MIAIRLMGGLGNQMHQFAFGTYLREVQQREVVYDFASFRDDPLRDYALASWRVSLTPATEQQRQMFPRRFGGRGWRQRLAGGACQRHIRERPWQFHPRYHALPQHAYCEGYWQGEKFFPDIRPRLLELFRPSQPLTRASVDVARQIEQAQAVAVHVRRTDYLNIPFLQVCTAHYYRRAIGQLLAAHERIELFVFSDDIVWCRQHLALNCPTHFVDHNTAATAHEDMWLISRCLHHVIPNSSFGWWGAWLSQRGGQTFAPDPWFADPKLGGGDIVPPHWHRVDVNRLTQQAEQPQAA